MTIRIDYDNITDLNTAILVIKKLQEGLNNSYSANFYLCPNCGAVMQEGWICPKCSYGAKENEE